MWILIASILVIDALWLWTIGINLKLSSIIYVGSGTGVLGLAAYIYRRRGPSLSYCAEVGAKLVLFSLGGGILTYLAVTLMAGLDGMDATRQIKALRPECKVLALTVHADEQYFFQMLAAAAEGYVTKQVAAEELVEAIRAVAAGNVYLQPALASWLLKDYRRLLSQANHWHPAEADKNHAAGLEMLSRRELQVLECVAQGMTSIQIGEALEISPKTVARHRERIMGKLHRHSSAELVRFAIRTGLVDIH